MVIVVSLLVCMSVNFSSGMPSDAGVELIKLLVGVSMIVFLKLALSSWC